MMKKTKILNFGSLNIDYVYDVPHFVCPGETLPALHRAIFAGGKGLNQSVALARAGGEVYHAGCIGDGGDILLETLERAGIDHRFVTSLPGKPPGHTVIQVDRQGQNCILVYGGANRMIDTRKIEETLSDFGEGDFLVLQNEINSLDDLIQGAHRKGMKIVLNPSPVDEGINKLPLELVGYFVVNEIEGAQIAGTDVIEEIIPRISQRYPDAKILLTLGAEGALYYDGSAVYRQPAFRTKVVDTIAAGDTFLGYFVSLISAGYETGEVLRLAAKAASIAVSKKGAADSIPKIDQVE